MIQFLFFENLLKCFCFEALKFFGNHFFAMYSRDWREVKWLRPRPCFLSVFENTEWQNSRSSSPSLHCRSQNFLLSSHLLYRGLLSHVVRMHFPHLVGLLIFQKEIGKLKKIGGRKLIVIAQEGAMMEGEERGGGRFVPPRKWRITTWRDFDLVVGGGGGSTRHRDDDDTLKKVAFFHPCAEIFMTRQIFRHFFALHLQKRFPTHFLGK